MIHPRTRKPCAYADAEKATEMARDSVKQNNLRPHFFDLSGRQPKTVACVPTGMKIGVWISPWRVFNVPRRAAPDSLSKANI